MRTNIATGLFIVALRLKANEGVKGFSKVNTKSCRQMDTQMCEQFGLKVAFVSLFCAVKIERILLLKCNFDS